jgi:hypothetical protein
MNLSTLKPLHGWRAFFGEVGVVVLGVLLALGAQQLVQDIQIRSDVREFRKTIDREIGMNVYALDLRASQFACDRRKLAQLTKWLDGARTETSAPAIYPHGPLVPSRARSAWDSRDAETYRQLPVDVRQRYAMFYDDIDNDWDLNKMQLATRSSLARFSEPGPMSLEDRREARSAINLLSRYLDIQEANIVSTKQLAKELGVKAIFPEDMPQSLLKRTKVCQSVFEP